MRTVGGTVEERWPLWGSNGVIFGAATIFIFLKMLIVAWKYEKNISIKQARNLTETAMNDGV